MKFKTKFNVGDTVQAIQSKRIFVVQDLVIALRSGETLITYFDHQNLNHTEKSLRAVHAAPRNSFFALRNK